MKYIKTILSCALAMLLLVSCTSKTPTETAEQGFDNAMTAMVIMDTKAIDKYFESNPLADDSLALSKKAEYQKLFMTPLTKNITYTISDVIEDGTTATATIEIHNKDNVYTMARFMSLIMDQMMKETMNDANGSSTNTDASTENLTREEQNVDAWGEYADENENYKDFTVTGVTMNWVKGHWVITNSDELTDALSGGLVTYANDLSSFTWDEVLNDIIDDEAADSSASEGSDANIAESSDTGAN